MSFLRLYHTVKHLKFEQIWFRFYYRFKKVKLTEQESQFAVSNSWYWNGPCVYSQSLFDSNSVEFLSKKADVSSSKSWNSPEMEKLWLYNLHYFDDLNSSNYQERKQWHINLIQRWIDENPPCSGNGWEPYPLSLRLVNWTKWLSRNNELNQNCLDSLLQQAEALSKQLEYHILGNHLFANAKALTFVGCYLKGEKSESFLDKGLKLLDREITEQFLNDGGHFELSPMYHEILLWDLLELIDLAQVTNNPKLRQRHGTWSGIAVKALHWLQCMVHPDKEISFFNDSAMGIAASPAQIFDYANRLNISSSKKLNHLETLPTSGYSRLSQENHTLIIDHANVGPDYLPGHAHADTLSFEWSVGKQRVFVNSGTSLYGVSVERLRQRSTAAHNTIVVDGQNSSEVWSGFRVARRAHASIIDSVCSKTEMKLNASHDGYQRLIGNVTHKREFISNKDTITILDKLEGQYKNAIAHFHIHPDLAIARQDEKNISLILPNKVKVLIESTSPIVIDDSSWHPQFGQSIPTKKLTIDLTNQPLVLKAVISQDDI